MAEFLLSSSPLVWTMMNLFIDFLKSQIEGLVSRMEMERLLSWIVCTAQDDAELAGW
ncbi:hypothetical protein COLO4_19626 [Corchorus olitorius]|uniref:Uncharacterized protein n=1 Tax=Corchorus olitorius TaxID=93759 RepID=A0A1R3J4E6_9ROSI|nr:hypothetical protein COLO4_19626 [Corchorus olitorius]